MKPIVLFVLLASSLHLAAQPEFSGWFATFNTVKLDKKFSLHLEAQFRSSNQWTHLGTLLLRGGVNYSIKKNIIATAGYGFIRSRRTVSEIPGYRPEHRIFEQLVVNHKLGYTSLSHRFRLEQRYLGRTTVHGNELQHNAYDLANRFRYFVRTILPIATSSDFKRGPFFALQNELFVNIGDKQPLNGETFDQNRAYGALGYRFHAKFDAEVGYMNQYVNGRNDAFTNNHIIQLAVYSRL